MLSRMVAGVTARWSAPGGYREVLGVSLPLVAGMASTTVMEFTDRLFLSHCFCSPAWASPATPGCS